MPAEFTIYITETDLIKDAEDKFRLFLKTTNSRITPERFEVLKAALSYKGHFGADELFLTMKNCNSHISRATIYNTLELLAECRLLSKRNFGENLNRYENTIHKKNHDHLVCTECGKIIEFSSPEVLSVIEKVSEEQNFITEDYSFIIYGKCKQHKTSEKNDI